MSIQLARLHQIGNDVGHRLFVERFLHSFGHDRQACAFQLIDVDSQHRVAGRFGAAERDAGRALGGNHSRHRAAILCQHNVIQVLRIDFAVRIQNVDQNRRGASSLDRRQVRADLVAESFDLMTDLRNACETGSCRDQDRLPGRVRRHRRRRHPCGVLSRLHSSTFPHET